MNRFFLRIIVILFGFRSLYASQGWHRNTMPQWPYGNHYQYLSKQQLMDLEWKKNFLNPFIKRPNTGHAPFLKWFVAQGVDVNCQDKRGRTALHCAVNKWPRCERNFKIPLLYNLLYYGADPFMPNYNGRTVINTINNYGLPEHEKSGILKKIKGAVEYRCYWCAKGCEKNGLPDDLMPHVLSFLYHPQGQKDLPIDWYIHCDPSAQVRLKNMIPITGASKQRERGREKRLRFTRVADYSKR